MTLAATVVSTYALDVVATAAGVLLAVSQLLDGLDRGLLLAFLVASYVFWGIGMRANLAANGTLLEQTGTSTNVLSKALFGLTRTRGPRTRRAAASAGYVATELVKEVPYYAGAFGATLASDSVGAHHALIFLGGANLGAALYEYGLARLTRVFLRRRHASFELHLADYLPGNLHEIERWLACEPDAHDWRPFVRYTLQCEGIADPTDEQVTQREELTRAKITRLLRADARLAEPVAERYATVISAYCADSATDDRATWETFMSHIAGVVRPGGLFITSALLRCRHYLVGGKRFPGANIDDRDLRAVLAERFTHATVEAREGAGHVALDYDGVVLAWAR